MWSKSLATDWLGMNDTQGLKSETIDSLYKSKVSEET